MKASVNAIGAGVTALVAVVFAVTKFTEGAWIVIVALPTLIFTAFTIRRHYDTIADELRIDLKYTRPHPHHVVSLILISGVHRVVEDAVSFAQSMYSDTMALYIGFDDESIEKIQGKWEEWGAPCRLIALKSEYRSLLQPLSRFVKTLDSNDEPIQFELQ